MSPFKQMPYRDLPAVPRLSHPYFDAEEQRVQVDAPGFGSVEMYYRVAGSGPPLLLVHGLMTASYSWRYVIEPLSQHFTVYMPDLLGSGRSAMPDAPYTPTAVADSIGAFMDAVGIAGCAVIGNSMGGYLCMHLALRRPTVMSRLLNLHSPGVPMAKLYALRSILSLPGSFSLLRALIGYDEEYWVFKNVHYYDETLKSKEEALEYALPLRTRAGVNAFGRILHETMNPFAMGSFADDLKAKPFPIPMMLLYAETDPIVPPWIGDALHRLVPAAELVWLKDASHFAHVDNPDAFLAAALPFVRN